MYVRIMDGLPIKIWANEAVEIEGGCLVQAGNLARLPFAFHQICLMPDTHQGYGMPIGGVLATENVVVPNAVGVDIGCGMAYLKTDIPAHILRETETPSGSLLQLITGSILRNIPVGFAHHQKRQDCKTLDIADTDKLAGTPELLPELDAGHYQVGTLGGGNHFIEIQESTDGRVSIMLHSGSRNIGKKICDHFNKRGRELNRRWHSTVPDKWELAFLPLDDEVGQQYLLWMQLAQFFATENRAHMLAVVETILFEMTEKYAGVTGRTTAEPINCHHNYAAMENHFGRNVLVHRKGAIRAREGDMGIIPGSMGSKSFIIRGKGCKDSFQTCSHGAGRAGSRKWALKEYTAESVMADLAERGVVLGKHKKNDVAEECRWAYKDIDQVMAQQTDLVEVVEELKTMAVVKG